LNWQKSISEEERKKKKKRAKEHREAFLVSRNLVDGRADQPGGKFGGGST